jgi:hypothetical protein
LTIVGSGHNNNATALLLGEDSGGAFSHALTDVVFFWRIKGIKMNTPTKTKIQIKNCGLPVTYIFTLQAH